MDSDSDDEAAGSKLGKHEHWESVYADELKNLEELGDEGENWCAFRSELSQQQAWQALSTLLTWASGVRRFGEDVLATMVTWTDSLLRSLNSAGSCAGTLCAAKLP